MMLTMTIYELKWDPRQSVYVCAGAGLQPAEEEAAKIAGVCQRDRKSV